LGPVQVRLRIRDMSRPGFLSPHRLARHTLVVACLAMVMLGQSWWSTWRAVGMVTGIEVCTAEGARFVDEQGQMSHVGHDCCTSGPIDALVPHIEPLPAMAQRHRIPRGCAPPGLARRRMAWAPVARASPDRLKRTHLRA